MTQELYLRTTLDNMTVPILEVIDSVFQLDWGLTREAGGGGHQAALRGLRGQSRRSS